MDTGNDGFAGRVTRLKGELIDQARRVQSMIEAGFESAFRADPDAAKRVIDQDEVIDKVDVQLEKSAVDLLCDATAGGQRLPPEQLRMVLTIVKVNNELERIADAAVTIAEHVPALEKLNTPLPDTLRVITNSTIGILRDATTSLDRLDESLAKVVLASEDAVEEFKKATLRDAQVQVASGVISVDTAFILLEVATQCEVMASHCTNIAEQALYVATGKIVRHMGGHWEEFTLPSS